MLYTLLFDKDEMVPVNPGREYVVPKEEAGKYRSGCRYLAWCEANVSKTPPKMGLDSHGPERDVVYRKCKDWLDGKAMKPNLTDTNEVSSWRALCQREYPVGALYICSDFHVGAHRWAANSLLSNAGIAFGHKGCK